MHIIENDVVKWEIAHDEQFLQITSVFGKGLTNTHCHVTRKPTFGVFETDSNNESGWRLVWSVNEHYHSPVISLMLVGLDWVPEISLSEITLIKINPRDVVRSALLLFSCGTMSGPIDTADTTSCGQIDNVGTTTVRPRCYKAGNRLIPPAQRRFCFVAITLCIDWYCRYNDGSALLLNSCGQINTDGTTTVLLWC